MDAAKQIAVEREAAAGLSQRDREILEFERHWWKYAGAKEQAVREKFDMSSTRYYQVLNALIDRPDALEADPLLVRRLRRLRASRQRQRSARRLGFERLTNHSRSAPSPWPPSPVLAVSRCVAPPVVGVTSGAWPSRPPS